MPSSDQMSERHRLAPLLKLRVLVAYLGEKDQYGWWPTSFLSPTGRRFLEFNFPRTVLSAGIGSVSQAAKALHDQRIGRRGVFHLFRLPHALEQDIHALLATGSEHNFVDLISGQEHALEKLGEIADSEASTGQGPVRVSGLGQLTHRPSVRKVAACYLDAFSQEHQTFPYFTTE
jgi:hypothetical protein